MARRGRPPKVDHRHQIQLDGLGNGEPGSPSTGQGDPLPSAVGLELTTEAVAGLYGVSSQQVRKWVRDGMPRVGRNRLRLVDVVAWRESRRDRRHAATEQAENAREELLREQTEGQRLRNQQRRAELIPLGELEFIVGEILTAAIALLDSAPAELAQDDDERAALLETLAHGIRAYLADRLDRLAEREIRRLARRLAAAEAPRGRVGRPSEVAARG